MYINVCSKPDTYDYEMEVVTKIKVVISLGSLAFYEELTLATFLKAKDNFTCTELKIKYHQ
jgi:hypothetical protein